MYATQRIFNFVKDELVAWTGKFRALERLLWWHHRLEEHKTD